MGLNKEHGSPPEGVTAGENVPLENQEDDFAEDELTRVANALKQRGEPFVSMSDSELREKAKELMSESNT